MNFFYTCLLSQLMDSGGCRERSPFMAKTRLQKFISFLVRMFEKWGFNSWRGKDYFSEFPAVLRSSA